MQTAVAEKFDRMRKVLNLQRPNRMPCGDMEFIEYRPDVYHLARPEFAVEPGQVGISRDGSKKYTADGGVWAVGDKEKYRDYNDSRNIDFGTPEDIYKEVRKLRELHQEFPGMMMYRGGGNPRPGNAEAFNRYFQELLVYE